MKFKEGLRELEFGREKKFVLSGKEDYLKDFFVSTARNIHKNHDFFIFHPEDEVDLLGVLHTQTLFSDRVVILKDFSKFDKMEEAVKVYDGILIIPLDEEANLKTPALTRILSLCAHVQCSKMSEYGSDYPTWISSKAAQKSYLFIDDAETVMFQRVGPDMFEMSNELEKLMLFKKDSKSITPDDIDKIVSKTAGHSTYEMFECLLRKNIKGALVCLDYYSKDNSGYGELVWFLGHYLEKMFRILLMHQKGMTVEAIAEVIGLPVFFIRKTYLPRSVAFGAGRIAEQISKLCDLEVQMRLFKGDHRILVEKLLYTFDDSSLS